MSQNQFWMRQQIRKRPDDKEHREQVEVIKWADAQREAHPEFAFLFAIANAGAGAQSGQAGKMKAEGVRPGVPDLCLPVPRGVYHGLYIEMKAAKGSESGVQKAWHEFLKQQGYYMATAYGADIAKQILTTYINMERPNA